MRAISYMKEEAMQLADITKEYVISRLEDMAEVLKTMPTPDRHHFLIRSSLPDPMESYWLAYNSDSQRDKLYHSVSKIRKSAKEVDDCWKACEWVSWASRYRPHVSAKMICQVLMLKSSLDISWRQMELAIQHRFSHRFTYSYKTLQRWYEQAIEDITNHLKNNGLPI